MQYRLRIARPVTDLAATREMYCHGLGLSILASFTNHAGFDGVILGNPGAPYHFEFTFSRNHPVTPTPTVEDLTVFYIPNSFQWQETCARMLAAGFEQVAAFNPYWEAQGRTYQDRDGYRIVLQNAESPILD